MDVNFKLDGMKEFEAKIAKLDGVTQFKVVKGAMMTAMNPVVKEARKRAPVGDSGVLARSIGRVVEKPKRLGKRITVSVGPKKTRKGDPFYWRFLEFGTRFVTARPFLLPAFRARGGEVLEVLAKQIEKRLAKIARTR